MRKARPFLLLGISLIAAVASSSLVYKWLRANAAQARSGEAVEVVEVAADTTMIAVASMDLHWGQQLSEDMVALVPFPSDYLADGYIEDLTEIEGRFLRSDVAQNEPLLEAKLAPIDSTVGGVAAVMDPSMRAMAVRVDDEIGVAGFVKPGDRVDLFVTIDSRGDKQAMAKLVMSNTLVLAIGTEMVRVGMDDEPRPVKVITLEVAPEDGEKLALAASEGSFRLALRHPLNNEPYLTPGADVDSLLASFKSGAPEEGKRKGHTVELIKGGTRSSVTF